MPQKALCEPHNHHHHHQPPISTPKANQPRLPDARYEYIQYPASRVSHHPSSTIHKSSPSKPQAPTTTKNPRTKNPFYKKVTAIPVVQYSTVHAHPASNATPPRLHKGKEKEKKERNLPIRYNTYTRTYKLSAYLPASKPSRATNYSSAVTGLILYGYLMLESSISRKTHITFDIPCQPADTFSGPPPTPVHTHILEYTHVRCNNNTAIF